MFPLHSQPVKEAEEDEDEEEEKEDEDEDDNGVPTDAESALHRLAVSNSLAKWAPS